MISGFTVILFVICVFLVWLLYLINRDRTETEKEKEAVQKQKEKMQKAYEQKMKEQKENEELETKMHSGTDGSFDASLELLQKYSKKKQ